MTHRPHSYLASAHAPVGAGREHAWAALVAVGGPSGWGHWNWLWRLRGHLDRLAGGPGLRGAHPVPSAVRPGDTLDWWRVAAVEAGSRLVLEAEMRLPGDGTLELVLSDGPGGLRVGAHARFTPHGLWGHAYWYALAPAHRLVFAGLVRSIAERAERLAASEAATGRG